MIWDLMGRLPLLARDYVDSIDGGSKLWNHVSKNWRLLVWRNETDEKFELKTSLFVINRLFLRRLLTVPLIMRGQSAVRDNSIFNHKEFHKTLTVKFGKNSNFLSVRNPLLRSDI